MPDNLTCYRHLALLLRRLLRSGIELNLGACESPLRVLIDPVQFDQVILNLAVGGYWPGDPDGSTSFPNELVVDYVRVTD